MYTDKNEYIRAGNEIHKYIKENFPDADLDYDDDIIPYADASAFARYIIRCYKCGKKVEVRRCLDLVERICGSRNADVSNLGVVGYIEDMMDFITENDGLYELLGIRSQFYYNELIKFWQGMGTIRNYPED